MPRREPMACCAFGFDELSAYSATMSNLANDLQHSHVRLFQGKCFKATMHNQNEMVDTIQVYAVLFEIIVDYALIILNSSTRSSATEWS